MVADSGLGPLYFAGCTLPRGLSWCFMRICIIIFLILPRRLSAGIRTLAGLRLRTWLKIHHLFQITAISYPVNEEFFPKRTSSAGLIFSDKGCVLTRHRLHHLPHNLPEVKPEQTDNDLRYETETISNLRLRFFCWVRTSQGLNEAVDPEEVIGNVSPH